MEEMQSPADEGYSLAMEVSDKKDIAIARHYAASALMLNRKDNDRGRKLAEQNNSDFQEINEPFWLSRSYITLGTFIGMQDQINWIDYASKRVELARETGERLELADALSEHAKAFRHYGQIDKATEYLEESDRLYKQIGAESNSANLLFYAEIALLKGKTEKAKSLLKEMQERSRLQGEKVFREVCSTYLGRLAMEEGNLDEAQEYFEESLFLANEGGFKPRIAWCLANQGNLIYLQGNAHAFKEKVIQSLSFRAIFTNSNKARILTIFLFTLSILEPENSALIIGATDNFQAEIDEPLMWDDKHYYDRAITHTPKVLGNEAFESAFAEGQKMSLDEALDLVLKTVEGMDE